MEHFVAIDDGDANGLIRARLNARRGLADGKTLALGTPAEVQNHPAVVEAYIGTTEANEKVPA